VIVPVRSTRVRCCAGLPQFNSKRDRRVSGNLTTSGRAATRRRKRADRRSNHQPARRHALIRMPWNVHSRRRLRCGPEFVARAGRARWWSPGSTITPDIVSLDAIVTAESRARLQLATPATSRRPRPAPRQAAAHHARASLKAFESPCWSPSCDSLQLSVLVAARLAALACGVRSTSGSWGACAGPRCWTGPGG
jgi:hypothetical protein